MTMVVEALALGSEGRSVMVKDTIDIAGYPTRACSRALEDAPPAPRHADVVQALLDAGCRINGKTSLHELAFGTTGLNAWVGTAENPRYPGRVPGGSSSGSAAAVAAGLADFSLGTDTGGSVRVPAACCGVFGLKPSFGRVSRQGVMPAQSSLDCVGPFAADMDMLIEAMRAIDPTFGALPAVADIHIGVVPVSAHPEIQAAVDAALRACGFPLQTLPLPGMQAAYDAGLAVINRETWNACGHLLESGRVGADVAARLLAARDTTDAALAAAEACRAAFTAEVDAALARCPILALPTMPDYPPLVADAADTRAAIGMTALVRPFNLSGHPALSLPFEGASKLPVGLQLVAAKGADELLCAVARELVRRLEP
ncbi:amidase [Zestomonas carbonaria]|uniref:Glutamyl-tRNA(Gln) amidotransferase subunit A n=1 Tax=Zestomonas carbonaria TaxID=2762745 RepID=A0A7U7EKB4_9GAMM|nr:amidase [Pseudomonas carbonaria]CAD5106228.1 Glutamyl-tRNA(Gln) amidotransferase subunit A [Pseudomonas carbonaria]